MNASRNLRLRGLFPVLVLLLAGVAPGAGDPPDSRVNPVTRAIEVATSVWIAGNYDISFVVNPTEGPKVVETVTSNPSDDLDPRMDGGPGGDTWVTWWRDGAVDEVLVRHRTSAGSWEPELQVADPSIDSRNPEIVHDGSRALIAFESSVGGARQIAAAIITDEPDPIGRHAALVATGYTGDLDVHPHTDGAHSWITWIDGDTELGWIEYLPDSDSWTSAAFESTTGTGVQAARAAVRLTITGN